MKKIFYFIILLLNFSFYAQRSGGGQRGGRQNQQTQQNKETKKFKTSEVAGLFSYEIEKVVRKLKIKDENKKASVIKLLSDYNFEIKEILLINADKFKDFDRLVNTEMQSRRNSGNEKTNKDKNGGIREKVQKLIRPIRQKDRKKEIRLNEDLAKILSKKQNKKWLKYQKTKKDKLKPKRPQANNNQGRNQGGNQRGNRQRGGF